MTQDPLDVLDTSVAAPPSYSLDPTQLRFGENFAPNMFSIEYHDLEWKAARLRPVSNLSLHPGTLGLHYGQIIFEGMKAFRQANGEIAIFRPWDHARRMNESARIMDMPTLPEATFVEGLRRLVRSVADYVPAYPGSLYIRPTMIATEVGLGSRSSSEYIFFALGLPTGSYFKEAKNGLGSIPKVLISRSSHRAVRGGTGAAKTAGNYAATLRITSTAKSRGCAQVLFLNAIDEGRIEEMGGMNIFFVRGHELLTPRISDTILRGVMRDSVCGIARKLGFNVREDDFYIDDILAEIKNGVVTEAIATGTAAAVAGISAFMTEDGVVHALPCPAPGPVAQKLFAEIALIQSGRGNDDMQWCSTV